MANKKNVKQTVAKKEVTKQEVSQKRVVSDYQIGMKHLETAFVATALCILVVAVVYIVI